jgi:aryl-alcohol dehydrogenase-like predicted oxidoreductase
MFDKGETFSGVDYEKGLEAVEEIRNLFHGRENLITLALRWILMFREVSCVIPGASSAGQLSANLGALDEENLNTEQMAAISDIYSRLIKDQVHHLW